MTTAKNISTQKNQREISESNISGAANSDFENEIK